MSGYDSGAGYSPSNTQYGSGSNNNNQNNSYGNNNSQQSSYNKGGNSGGYEKKERKSNFVPQTTPYFPFALIFEDDCKLNQPEIDQVNKLVAIANDHDMVMRVKPSTEGLAFNMCKTVEFCIPMPKFDDLENHIPSAAQDKKIIYSGMWNKKLALHFYPGKEKGLLHIGAKVNMLVGSFNQAPARAVVIFTRDGADNMNNVGKETGWSRQTIELAGKLGVPVVNLANGEHAVAKFLDIVSGIPTVNQMGGNY